MHRRDLVHELEPVHPGHLDIEEHEVRLRLDDAADSGRSIAGFPHDLEIGSSSKSEPQALARERLVVYEDGADPGPSHGAATIFPGKWSETRAPPAAPVAR